MYREKSLSFWKHIDFILVGALAQEAAFALAYWVRFSDETVNYANGSYKSIAIIIGLIEIAVSIIRGSYSGVLHRGWLKEIRATVIHCLIVFSCLLMYLFAIKQTDDFSRLSFGYYMIFSCMFMYMVRVTWKILVRKRVIRKRKQTNLIMIADRKNVDRVIKSFKDNVYSGFTIVAGVCMDEDLTGQVIDSVPFVASKETLFNYVRTNVIDQAFIDMENINDAYEIGSRLIEIGVTVHIGLVYEQEQMPTRIVEDYNDYAVLTGSMRIANMKQVIIKRMMDIIGSLVGLIFMAIAFIIFAPIIKIQSPGPVFYKSVRIGKNGRRFNFYKFRSMHVDADKRLKDLQKDNEIKGLMFKMENDPRIIPIGHFMRKYSIDELPQFWNVLVGDMSLVGTRPPTEGEFENYEYHHKARLAIKPGLTGLWQVSGRSDIKDFEDVVKLDTKYISNWTLGLDIKILFKTVGVVLTGSGSK